MNLIGVDLGEVLQFFLSRANRVAQLLDTGITNLIEMHTGAHGVGQKSRTYIGHKSLFCLAIDSRSMEDHSA